MTLDLLGVNRAAMQKQHYGALCKLNHFHRVVLATTSVRFTLFCVNGKCSQPTAARYAPSPGSALIDYVYRMGELEPWIDENFVRSVWFNMGEQVNVKMIRDKFSG